MPSDRGWAGHSTVPSYGMRRTRDLQLSTGKVLMIDDDSQFRRVLRKVLIGEGYEVAEAANGKLALEMLQRARQDLVLLDMAMPAMNGLETCRAIRAFSDVPIIAVSVRHLEKDKITALDSGADDYITKPFSLQELLARIRAALRRRPAETTRPPLRLPGLEIDFTSRRVAVAGREVRLTRREFELLQFLASNANTSLSHRKLLQAVWGPEYGSETVYLRVYINQLRKKIEQDPHHPRYIQTDPCVGYRFVAPEAEREPETPTLDTPLEEEHD